MTARDGDRRAVEALIERGLSQPLQATDYDTSWALRLKDPDGRPSYPHLVQRFLDRQREDGSWGGQVPNAHDRLLTTLSVAISLHAIDDPGTERSRAAAEDYLRRHAVDLDPESDLTIGFELIFPGLLEEAARLGLDLPYQTFEYLERIRAAKLALLPQKDLFRRYTTALFSLEAFHGNLDVESASGLLLDNGSMANSPSATASLMSRIPDWRERQPRSAAYLDAMILGPDPGLPVAQPVDIFVRAWTVYYLQNGGIFEAYREVLQPFLDYLGRHVSPEGVWFASEGGTVDSDDTAMTLLVLDRAGYEVEGSALLRFEGEHWFSTQEHESNPSVSTNLHVLEALDTVPGEHQVRVRDKILAYLFDARQDGAYWRDKWHASLYYPTTGALAVLREHAPAELEPTLGWILRNQRPDGSWGEFAPTTEETSLVLLSLLGCHRAVRDLPEEPMRRAAAYLLDNMEDPEDGYPELWIGKSLYAPSFAIEAARLSALALFEDTLGGAR